MLASDAINGRMYQLEKKDYRPSCEAECYGLNSTKDFMLFLFFDKWTGRKILAVPLEEKVIPK